MWYAFTQNNYHFEANSLIDLIENMKSYSLEELLFDRHSFSVDYIKDIFEENEINGKILNQLNDDEIKQIDFDIEAFLKEND